jgi:thiol-disulfide isomerase/thioredoxin
MLAPIFEIWNNLSITYKAAAGIALLAIVYVVFTWYQKRSANAPNQVTNAPNASGAIVCSMYYVDWCKFCKKAKPEWEKLENEYNGKIVNGKKIVINSINCDENEEVAEQENIKGYPTFKFNMDGKYVDFPDEPVYDKFKTFIEYLSGQ